MKRVNLSNFLNWVSIFVLYGARFSDNLVGYENESSDNELPSLEEIIQLSTVRNHVEVAALDGNETCTPAEGSEVATTLQPGQRVESCVAAELDSLVVMGAGTGNIGECRH
jgi:hypothetical protein